jgi:hypothetical protein
MTIVLTILTVVWLAGLAFALYLTVCYVVGRIAGAIARYRHPLTEREIHEAELAAREATRPWCEPINVTPIDRQDLT